MRLERPDQGLGFRVVGAQHQLGRLLHHPTPLGGGALDRPARVGLDGAAVFGSHRLDATAKLGEPVLVRIGRRERVVVLVNADLLENRRLLELDDLSPQVRHPCSESVPPLCQVGDLRSEPVAGGRAFLLQASLFIRKGLASGRQFFLDPDDPERAGALELRSQSPVLLRERIDRRGELASPLPRAEQRNITPGLRRRVSRGRKRSAPSCWLRGRGNIDRKGYPEPPSFRRCRPVGRRPPAVGRRPPVGWRGPVRR